METATSGSSADPPPLTDPPASDDGPPPHTDPPTSDDDDAPPPQADEEDPLASLPAGFAAFSLTQTHPKTGDAKAEPFEQQRQYKTRMCIYGDKCPYGPGRCFFAHEEAELRPPQARWWLPEYKTKPCRYSSAECPFYAEGRCQYAHTVEELQYVRQPPVRNDAKYKTRMCRHAAGSCPYGIACSYAHHTTELRAAPDEPDEPPGAPSDVVSRLERLRDLRASGSISQAEFEDGKRQVLNEPGAGEGPALLAPSAVPRRRRRPPPPADAYMLPAMPMPRAPPLVLSPFPPQGYGYAVPGTYPPMPYPAMPRPPVPGAYPMRPPRGYSSPPAAYRAMPRPPGYAYGAPAPAPPGYAMPRPPGHAYGAPPPPLDPAYPMRPPFDPRRIPHDGSPGHEGGSPRPAL